MFSEIQLTDDSKSRERPHPTEITRKNRLGWEPKGPAKISKMSTKG
jgi:hypothetical protein